MTAVMRAVRPPPSGPRWLRYALLVDGRIVDERVVAPDKAVTLGASPYADIHQDSVEGRRELLVFREGRWLLRYDEAWAGRLHTGSLAERDDPTGADGFRECALSRDARARLELGGASLLVQLIDRPPVRLRPQLPASLMGGLIERADWWFTAFVTGSFLAHFMVLAFVMEADWPVEPAGTIPDRIGHIIFQPIEPPADHEVPEIELDEQQVAEAEAVDGDAAEDGSERPPTTVARRTPRPRISGDPSLADARAREAMTAAHLMLGSLLEEQDGSGLTDLIRTGAATEDAASVFATVESVDIATSSNEGQLAERVRGQEGSAQRGLDALARERRGSATHSTMSDEGGPVAEVVLSVRPPGIDELDPAGSAEFDARELLRRLRGRMGRVRNCYEREITRGDPNIEGRITLTMTVMPVGSLSSVVVDDNNTGSSSLGQCAVNSVRTVRVSTGPSSPVEVRYPLVFARQE